MQNAQCNKCPPYKLKLKKIKNSQTKQVEDKSKKIKKNHTCDSIKVLVNFNLQVQQNSLRMKITTQSFTLAQLSQCSVIIDEQQL